MFPIICLSCQIEAINRYIKRFQLSKEAVYLWLSYYGQLVREREDISKSWSPYMQGMPFAPCFIYWSHLGFRNNFSFIEENQIEILSSGIGGFPFDRNKKWVQE